MTVIQLHELIPVETALGSGYAVIFETGGHDNYWTVALEDGAFVTFRQEDLRPSSSYTHGRGTTTERMREIIKLPIPGSTTRRETMGKTGAKDSSPKGAKFVKNNNKSKTNDKDTAPKGEKFVPKGKKNRT